MIKDDKNLGYKILTYLTEEGIFCVLTDQNNNIVYPCNIKQLDNIKNVLNNKDEIVSEFFDDTTNHWYDYRRKSVEDNLKFELFKDITVYKKREEDLQTDETTKLSIKKKTFEQVDEYIKEAAIKGEDFVIAIGDADKFKSVNDTYGHNFGDKILNDIGAILLKNTRQIDYNAVIINESRKRKATRDIVGRIGGEEFLIILKNTDKENGIKKIDSIRREVEKHVILYNEKHIPSCTMSFGVYFVNHETVKQLLESTPRDEVRSIITSKADKALYNSKETGRNKVTVYDDKEYNKEKTRIREI